MAIVWALKKFRLFVWGADIVVLTDHHALCCLLTKRDLTGRLARMSLWCQEHRLRIIHKSGRLHTDADPLSRYPSESDPSNPEEDPNHVMFYSIQALEQPIMENLKTAQRGYHNFSKIIKEIMDPKKTYKGKFHLINDLLYIKPTLQAESRLCIPPGPMRNDILKANHDFPIAGHLGVQRTLAKIRLRYYWPRMSRHITSYVLSCEKCQTRKAPKQRPAGFMESITATAPFDRLGLAIRAIFPLTKRQLSYHRCSRLLHQMG